MGRARNSAEGSAAQAVIDVHLEEVLLEALDSLEAGVLIVALDGRIVHVNSSMERILGYRREEMVGSMCFDLVDADYVGLVRENLSRRKQGKSSFYSIYLAHKSGNSFPVSLAANPMRDKDGKIYASVFTVVPINCSQALVCYAPGKQSTAVSLGLPKDKENLVCSNLTLYPSSLKCSVGNETFELSPILFKLLERLVNNKDKLVTRTEIIDYVWQDSSLNDRLLDGHILKLRRILKDFQGELRTVYGEGYILQPSASPSKADSGAGI